jgi:hypothetical protein
MREIRGFTIPAKAILAVDESFTHEEGQFWDSP